MPADRALFRVVHAFVSTAPVDFQARGIMNPKPLLLKHAAVVELTAALTSTPVWEPPGDGVGGTGVGLDPLTQH